MTKNTLTCKVCHKTYESPEENPFLCPNCEEEYSEWLESKGFNIGEFDDPSHPKYVPNPRMGTKWEKMDS